MCYHEVYVCIRRQSTLKIDMLTRIMINSEHFHKCEKCKMDENPLEQTHKKNDRNHRTHRIHCCHSTESFKILLKF